MTWACGRPRENGSGYRDKAFLSLQCGSMKDAVIVSSEEIVTVRRRWNGSDVAQISVRALWDFHFRNDADGVCRALPRAFLYAHVWCDKLPGGALGHFCREGPPPHNLRVCILPNDNAELVYESLRAKTRR
jgi:hypothetical protein